ncbi:39S ribosomal protein L45, mitochondrial [Quaeritorhiza haematococci]|nr:39S ribosomal protein L45, mitochondrial [Quaeritorhiza haematococci]
MHPPPAHPWVPAKTSPPITTKEGRKYLWVRTKKFLISLYSISQVKKYTPSGWKPIPFAQDAEEQYIKMNEAFAKGDKERLKTVVTEAMLAKMNPELKALQKAGSYQWQYHGSVERPRVVNTVMAKLQYEPGSPEHKLAQITVRLKTKQSVALYQGSKLVGGDPNAIQEVEEYIVMQRILTKEGEPWLIAGKISLAQGEQK